MDKNKLFDLIVVLFIVAAGLGTAYVTFGILQSSAEGSIQQYKVGGAIAGALISWSMLASLYLQIRKSSGEVEELRERNQELQQKLIRGAPRPSGFDTEVAEQQRIVLARPKDWVRRGGIIFDYEQPGAELIGGDIFSARFTSSFIPVTEEHKDRDRYYKAFPATIDRAFIASYTPEVVYLGGEPNGIKSLKFICRQYARVIEENIRPPVPRTGFSFLLRRMNTSRSAKVWPRPDPNRVQKLRPRERQKKTTMCRPNL